MVNKQNLSTKFIFTLPKGLLDNQGSLHRKGLMRLATARDEIYAHKDPRVQQNSSYIVLIYLSQVITCLGSLSSVTPKLLEGLYVQDLAYLRQFYNHINQHRDANIPVECPHCENQFSVKLELPGES